MTREELAKAIADGIIDVGGRGRLRFSFLLDRRGLSVDRRVAVGR